MSYSPKRTFSNQAKKVGGFRHSWHINVRDAAAVRRQVADDDLMFGRNALSSNCVKKQSKFTK